MINVPKQQMTCFGLIKQALTEPFSTTHTQELSDRRKKSCLTFFTCCSQMTVFLLQRNKGSGANLLLWYTWYSIVFLYWFQNRFSTNKKHLCKQMNYERLQMVFSLLFLSGLQLQGICLFGYFLFGLNSSPSLCKKQATSPLERGGYDIFFQARALTQYL